MNELVDDLRILLMEFIGLLVDLIYEVPILHKISNSEIELARLASSQELPGSPYFQILFGDDEAVVCLP